MPVGDTWSRLVGLIESDDNKPFFMRTFTKELGLTNLAQCPVSAGLRFPTVVGTTGSMNACFLCGTYHSAPASALVTSAEASRLSQTMLARLLDVRQTREEEPALLC